MVFQQQHSSQVQLGHTVADLVSLHSAGRQPQSAHLIWNIVLVSSKILIKHSTILCCSEGWHASSGSIF